MTAPLRLRVPHDETDETDESKVASFPNPDHDAVDKAFGRANDLLFSKRLGVEDEAAVRMLYSIAEAYMHLTTYDLGQEVCVTRLRQIWRARRAAKGGAK